MLRCFQEWRTMRTRQISIQAIYWLMILTLMTMPSYNDATTKKPRWTPNSETPPDNAGWNPIGFFNSDTDNAAFTGTFDGGGKTISNLFINRRTTDYVGLFGYVDSGWLCSECRTAGSGGYRRSVCRRAGRR